MNVKNKKQKRNRWMLTGGFLIIGLLAGTVLSLGDGKSKKVVSLEAANPNQAAEAVSEHSVELLPGSTHKKRLASLNDNSDLSLIELFDKERCYSRGLEAVVEKPSGELTPEEIDDDVRKFSDQNKAITEALSQSTDGDHLFVAAIFGSWHDKDHGLFAKAISYDSENSLYRFHFAAECVQGKIACDARRVLDELVRVDADNSEAYLLRAMRYFESDQLEMALSDLQRAATMPRTEDYHAELVLTIEQALGATGMGFSERVSMAFGISAATGSQYAILSKMCREMSALDERWRFGCIEYLENAEQQATTLIAQSIALSVLRKVLDNGPDIARRNEAERRYVALRESHNEWLRDMVASGYDSQYYLLESPRLFYDYMNHMKAHGERSAQLYLDEESKRLRASGWLSPCEHLRRITASDEQSN